MIDDIAELSESLRPILEYEIARGNEVVRVDRPAGTNCPLAVIFAKPLDFGGFVHPNEAAAVRIWQNRDRHYPLERGYVCERTRHALAGPAGD